MLVCPEVMEITRRLKGREQLSDFMALERYQENFYFSVARMTILHAGNRAGKTKVAAKKVCDIATHRHPTICRKGPQQIRVVSESTKLMKKTVVPLVREFIPAHWLKTGSWDTSYHIQDGVLYLKDGGTFQFMTYEQKVEAFRGVPLDIVWNDEQGPVDIFDENISRLGDRRGICINTLTPEKGASYLHKRYTCRAKPGSDIEYFHFNVLMNPYIDRIWQIKQLALMPPKKLRIKLYGDVVSLEGLIFEEFDPRVHVIRPFVVPEGWQIFIGVDLGWRNPTAVTFWAISPNQEVRQIHEMYRTKELIVDTGKRARDLILGKFAQLDFRFGVIDARSARQTSRQTGETDYRKFMKGFGMGPMYMSSCSRDAVINRNDCMHELLMVNPETNIPRYQVSSNCRNTIFEFGEYSTKPDNIDSDLNKKEIPASKNDHAMDANGILAERKPMYRVFDVSPVHLNSPYRRGGIV